MLPGKYLGIISTPSSITKSNNCTMMCVRSFICSLQSSTFYSIVIVLTKVKKGKKYLPLAQRPGTRFQWCKI